MICWDTMVLIWGIQGVSRPDQGRMVELAKRYIETLSPKETIMVPAVALSEYLAGFPDQKKRELQLAILRRRYFIAAFDIRAAALAAEIGAMPEANELSAKFGRVRIKADIQIIATAVAHGADTIMTAETERFKKLAGERIKVIEVPETHLQTRLDLEPKEPEPAAVTPRVSAATAAVVPSPSPAQETASSEPAAPVGGAGGSAPQPDEPAAPPTPRAER